MRIALLAAAGLVLAACSKPEPPELKVKTVQVTGADLSSLTFHVGVEAFNPNRIALSARRVTGTVRIDGKDDLGTATVDTPISLPAGERTMIDVPLAVKWQNIGIVSTLLARAEPIPYEIKGTATFGTERFSVDKPFEAKGTFTREELTNAAVRGVSGLLQGFQLPPAASSP